MGSGPLDNLEQWDDYVQQRYRRGRKQEEFRRYDEQTPEIVRNFYLLNHTHQTREFVLAKKRQYLPKQQGEMGIWEAMEKLNALVDDSDPDTDLTQMDHNLQTAEAIRAAGHPRWFVLAGFIHDLGKMLCFYGEPQWAVVGDTFPVGCRFSERIVFPEFFAHNPDTAVTHYSTPLGIYEEHCGLDKVDMSWGHDEYLYQVVKDNLPEPALYMIRYHSFYAAHREGEYQQLMNAHDREMFAWVRAFNPYDLYSKSAVKPNFAELRPYYEDLVAEYFGARLRW